MMEDHNADGLDFESGLEEYLRVAAIDGDLRVDRVLKESEQEKTEVVYLEGASGSRLGPFVRKTFPGMLGERTAINGYDLLFHAQQQGKRFSGLPRVILCADQVDRQVVLMEYVPGRSLDQWIVGSDEELRLAICAQVIPQLCGALTELHRGLDSPVIHRDVKPSNIVCTGDGRVPESAVLVDLGISRVFKPGESSDTQRLGTVGFAAPEQYGYQQTDERTDVFGAGMTMAYCLLGRMPSVGEMKRGLVGICSNQRLCAIARKATAFDPDDRYQTARAMGEAVLKAFWDMAEDARPAEGRPAEPAEPLAEQPRMNARQAMGTAVPRGAGNLLGRFASRFGRLGRMARGRVADDDLAEFCPSCGAILSAQPGFRGNNGFWICRACGQQLFGDGVYAGNRFPGVVWYCDQCGDLLNAQPGFDDIRDSWQCRRCGYVNKTSESEIDG